MSRRRNVIGAMARPLSEGTGRLHFAEAFERYLQPGVDSALTGRTLRLPIHTYAETYPPIHPAHPEL